MAMVVHAVAPKNRGKALGFTVTGVYLATSLSPVICGFLVHNLGWRSMFYFVIPFLVLCIILMITKIPQEWKTYQDDKIDKVGSILYGIGILFFIYGFTSLITTPGKILTVLGIILLVIFGAYELRQSLQEQEVHIIKHRRTMQLHCGDGRDNNIELPLPVRARMGCPDVRNDIDHYPNHHGNHGAERRKAVRQDPPTETGSFGNGNSNSRIADIDIPDRQNTIVYGNNCDDSSGYRNGTVLKSEHERNHEFRSAKGRSYSFSITGNNENNRPDHELRSFDIGIRLDNGQSRTCPSIC